MILKRGIFGGKIKLRLQIDLEKIGNLSFDQGIRIKGREMALVWHEKVSRTALQTSSLSQTHTFLIQTHNMTTVKEIAEQCRQL